MAYTTTRRSDSLMSDHVGKFMDEHFYSALGERWQRVTDYRLQWRGVDVIFGGCKIDEKVKVKSGYLNKLLEYPSFELSFVNRKLKRQCGWFLSPDSMTDYYAFIAVYADVADERSIRYDVIDHLNVLFVNKADVVDYVKTCGIDLQSDVDGLSTEKMGERISHVGTGIHMKISLQFSEKPINMVVSRDVLYGLEHTREFDVYPDFVHDTRQ